MAESFRPLLACCTATLPGAIIGALLVLFFYTSSARAEGGVALFASGDQLGITLSAPWREIVRDSRNQAPYPATLRYADESGGSKRIALTVERRGKTRQEVCRFPPIRLRFDSKDVAGTVFAGNKSIKMVTHCNNGQRWEQYYVLEMLAYRIYNLITDRSFRVRPLSVTYRDSARDNDDGPRFAFMIEDDKLVADRNGLDKFDAVEIRPEQLDSLESSRFALFQYLVGNADWSSLSGPPGDGCCHNAKLIAPESGAPVYALPYDFDSAGLVDAPYAVPNEALRITRVTQRLFRGFCLHNATLQAARAEFLDTRRAIEMIVETEPRLQSRYRSRAIRYLGDFFDVAEDDVRFERAITDACRR
ncbi:MAG TPA: hypothetical protein VJ908_08900 [Wenzhouxiangellaceae bacterium]|nr:hypothetical protein [Wenzhouxiangellaceae bacterium]